MNNTPGISLEALEVLDAIDKAGSYAAAADHLNRVPSAISYSVQKLEQDLNITLFQREGRRSILTPAGKHLLEHGRTLLDAAHHLAASTKQVATGWEPHLRIAIDHLLPEHFLMPALQQLYAQHAHISIDIRQEVLAGAWEALLEDRVDLVIGAVDGMPSHSGIRSVPWREQQMIAVCSPAHPAAKLDSPLTEDDLSDFTSVIVHDSSRQMRSLNRGLLNGEQAIYVPNMSMKIQAHMQGLGVGTVPKARVEQALKEGSLVELALNKTAMVSRSYLAWRVSNRGRALQWLLDWLKENSKA